jgi:serine/threonine-protein kinase
VVTTGIPEALQRALGDGYRLEEEIGRGGMATVYRAEDLRHGRAVAIKVLRPELAGLGDLPARFQREIRIAARLVHPHILPVHDSGARDGLLFYVMPYLGCESLRVRMERDGQMPIAEVLRIVRDVASALDYAHRQNVVHRDIKPENVLLAEGHPVVADFGIARAIAEAGGERLSQGGIAIGTPAYMSPEQASGEPDIDGRSDQYSLACVAYEMVVGHPPFPGGGVRATIARHLSEKPPPLRPARAAVPPAVEWAIMKALAKAPADRFATATEFAEALAHAAPGHEALTMVTARDARAIAVLPFVNASRDPDDEYLSDGVTEELITALAQVEGLHVASRTSTFAYRGRPVDVRTIGTELDVAYVLEGMVRRSGTQLRISAQLSNALDARLIWSARYDREAMDVLALQDEIARTIVATLRSTMLGDLGDPLPRRYTENPRAYHLYLRGRHAWNRRTREGTVEGIGYFEQAIAEDPAYALAYTGLADCYAIQIDYRGVPVKEGMERAKAEALRAIALDGSLAEAYTSLAWVTFIYEWDWAAAEQHFRRAIELNPRYATAHQWYAWLLLALGRTEEALLQGRLAVELDPASVSIRRSLGWALHSARQPEAAIAYLRRTLALDPVAEETHRVLGLAYLQKGLWADAQAAFEQAIALAPATAYSLAGLGATHALAGRHSDARGVLEQLEARRREGYVSPVAFAMVHAALGDADRTFEWLERSWQERRGWLVYLRTEPLLDRLRGDPRFEGWLRRMGLA